MLRVKVREGKRLVKTRCIQFRNSDPSFEQTCESNDAVPAMRQTVSSRNSPINAIKFTPISLLFKLQLTDREAFALLHLLEHNPSFRECFTAHLKGKHVSLEIRIRNWEGEGLDRLGWNLAWHLLLREIEMEDALHWLSTLGGAFSNLGEHNINFAMKAHRNALQQLKLVSTLSSDPSLQQRCWLFLALSEMQQGRIDTAASIVRTIYRQSRLEKNSERIVKMCKGVWARIQYAFRTRRVKMSNK